MKASDAAKISNKVQNEDNSDWVLGLIRRACEQGKHSIKLNGGINFGTARKLEELGYSVYTQRSHYWANWDGEEKTSSKFVTTIAW